MSLKFEDYNHIGRVWNRGPETYTESFKNQKISIPPGKSIDMPLHEAERFLGRHSPTKTKVEHNGKMVSKVVYKALELEHIWDPKTGPKGKPAYVCPMCGQEYAKREELDAHIKSDHVNALTADEGEKIAKRAQAKKASNGY